MASRVRDATQPEERAEAAPAPRHAAVPQAQVATVLALQRSAGNAAVSRRLARFKHTSAAPTFTGSKSRPMLRANQTDPAVNELQDLLNKAGAVPLLTATGTMDGPTRQAVVKFQGESGLQRDCIVGPLTWGALDRVTGTPSGTVGPDQHEGVHNPTADEQSTIHQLLFPARGKDDTQWDGAGGSPEALANRAALKAAMTQAIKARWTRSRRTSPSGRPPTGCRSPSSNRRARKPSGWPMSSSSRSSPRPRAPSPRRPAWRHSTTRPA